MINIPVKTGNKNYYICFMSNDLSNDLGSTAQSYTKITKIINFTLKTISPSDITVSTAPLTLVISLANVSFGIF